MGQLGKTPLQAEKSSWEWQVIYSNLGTKLYMLTEHPRSPEHFSVCPRANPTCMLPTPLFSHHSPVSLKPVPVTRQSDDLILPKGWKFDLTAGETASSLIRTKKAETSPFHQPTLVAGPASFSRGFSAAQRSPREARGTGLGVTGFTRHCQEPQGDVLCCVFRSSLIF